MRKRGKEAGGEGGANGPEVALFGSTVSSVLSLSGEQRESARISERSGGVDWDLHQG